MATPSSQTYRQSLYDFAGIRIAELVRNSVPSSGRILDVGAGWGKYRFLLPEYEFDAVEVWQPYVEPNKLQAFYRKVFIEDIVEKPDLMRYDAVTMGDVLEHITAKDAQKVVKKLCSITDNLFIAVPFEMIQHEVEGNHHEAHLQDDLTEAIMAERFPELELIDQHGWVETHIKAIYGKKK